MMTRTQKFEAVVHEVMQRHEIDRTLLLANKPRWAFAVKARQELAYKLRRRYRWSVTIIARLTKAADHTVVVHRIKSHCITNRRAIPKGLDRTRSRKIK